MSYNSRDDDIVNEFYVPCFQQAVRYDRAVGFFTSNLLIAISSGIYHFIARQGIMRLICSPKLTEEDIESISKGYRERDRIIEECLQRDVDLLPTEEGEAGLHHLSWLIANSKLEIKVAVPKKIGKDSYGIYHEKIGVFYDENEDFISFFGSNNETLASVRQNYESFDVFKSWDESDRCNHKAYQFDRVWSGLAPGLEVFEFPVAIARRIVERIRPEEMPYYDIVSSGTLSEPIYAKVDTATYLEKLWEFQREAVQAFESNNCRGLLSMATGTGKTKTAIAAILKLLDARKRLAVIIVAPQNTIVRQWQNEIDSVNRFQRSIVADGTNQKWPDALADVLADYDAKAVSSLVVYTTYNTLCSPKFKKIVAKASGEFMLVCDEVHWVGADMFASGLLDQYQYRLGLSATPQRHMDDTGTDVILTFFEKVVFEFSLERALTEINPATGETFLCPYTYHPIFVALNSDELNEYIELSQQISRQYAKERLHNERSAQFQRLCEKRQLIITNADSKYTEFEALLKSLKNMRHTLIYCSPEQIDRVLNMCNHLGVVNHRFTGAEGTKGIKDYKGASERDFILSHFEQGTYKALVAMKCLDEGINVPNARTGILLASSGNPKQYIQRRGRLLRRCPGKESVRIFDFIVIPYEITKKPVIVDKAEKKILEAEFKRYEEFASLATNRIEAVNRVFEIKNRLGFFSF